MDENKNDRRISVSSVRDDVEEFTRTASSRRQSMAGGAGFTRLHKSIGRKLYEKFAAPAVLMLRKDQAVAENKSITKKDIRVVEQFLQTPVAEELFSNLLEYLHSGSGESPEGLASKMQGAELAALVKRMAEKPLVESQQGIALASSYRQVLLRGSNIRVLSRERAFFELLYHYANILGYASFPASHRQYIALEIQRIFRTDYFNIRSRMKNDVEDDAVKDVTSRDVWDYKQVGRSHIDRRVLNVLNPKRKGIHPTMKVTSTRCLLARTALASAYAPSPLETMDRKLATFAAKTKHSTRIYPRPRTNPDDRRPFDSFFNTGRGAGQALSADLSAIVARDGGHPDWRDSILLDPQGRHPIRCLDATKWPSKVEERAEEKLIGGAGLHSMQGSRVASVAGTRRTSQVSLAASSSGRHVEYAASASLVSFKLQDEAGSNPQFMDEKDGAGGDAVEREDSYAEDESVVEEEGEQGDGVDGGEQEEEGKEGAGAGNEKRERRGGDYLSGEDYVSGEGGETEGEDEQGEGEDENDGDAGIEDGLGKEPATHGDILTSMSGGGLSGEGWAIPRIKASRGREASLESKSQLSSSKLDGGPLLDSQLACVGGGDGEGWKDGRDLPPHHLRGREKPHLQVMIELNSMETEILRRRKEGRAYFLHPGMDAVNKHGGRRSMRGGFTVTGDLGLRRDMLDDTSSRRGSAVPSGAMRGMKLFQNRSFIDD